MTLAARNRLVLEHLPLVETIAAQLKRRWRHADRGDLMQDGVLGLMRAIAIFDSSRGVYFKTYAAHWVRGTMLKSLHKIGPVASPVLPDPVERREWPDAIAERREAGRMLALAAAKLSPRQRQLVRIHYAGENSLPETAEKMGICRETAGQYRAVALNQMAATLKLQGVRL